MWRHIVNTASGAGLAATGSGVLYQTAKYGVVGLSEALQEELGPLGTGVTVLCPGPVATGIIARTRALQPSVVQTLTAEQLSAARMQSAKMAEALAAAMSPDNVGEMVLDAVRNNRLYVHTD